MTRRNDAAIPLDGLRDAFSGEFRAARHDRMLYATDASLYQAEPLAVAIPDSVADAKRAFDWCVSNGVAVLPRGGGTSLAGQGVSRAVVIDLSPSCRSIGAEDPERRTIEVEPGATPAEVNRELARRGTGLFFAPDPATVKQACVGGVIGNNAAGTRSIRYGRTSENVAAIDAALASGRRVCFESGAAKGDSAVRDVTRRVAEIVQRNAGRIRDRFPKTLRRNAGYNLDLVLDELERHGGDIEKVNLAPLLAGSEGTLALTLGARLLLHPVPVARGLALVSFRGLEAAIDAVGPILETGPTAVELVDDLVIDLARKNLETRRYVDRLPRIEGADPRAALYVEYASETTADEVRERFEALGATVGDAPMNTYTDAASMEQAWALRRAGEPLLHGLPGDRKPITFVEDNAVPVERLPEFVRRMRAIVEPRGTRAAFYAHASVGVLHVRPLLSVKSEDDLRLLREIAVETADLAQELGGVMSGEHGDGRARTPLLERFYGPELMEAMRKVKAVFDPKGLLNPGNIVEPRPVESITVQLRVDPSALGEPKTPRRIPEVETYFDYADQHGFDGAIEACNGAGVCRKRFTGTMCPSYMALLDERHTTRGRANALRLALTGQFNGQGPKWDDGETIETLDLCLSCKACKAECPTNVDLARLKAEYTAQRYARRGTPLRVRIQSRLRTIQRLAGVAPGLANLANRFPPTAALARAAMGVAGRRSLPPFGRSIEGKGSKPESGRDAPRVALFADCFCAFGEAEIGRDAVRLLEAFGYAVEVPRVGCCARPAISLGNLDAARAQIPRTLESLRAAIEDGGVRAILVMEPSCLSAFLDDWPALKVPEADRALIDGLAKKAALVEDFLAQRWDEHPRRPPFAPRDGDSVVLHGHCHQKALWGSETSAALLRRVYDGRVEVPDTGCCGMAGAFGYAPHRFDLSVRIAEHALLPALREAPEGATAVAPGTSCRHQLRDTARIEALHPVQAAARALRPG